MQRVWFRVVTLAFLALAANACGGEEIDEAGAARLWQRIHDEEYRAWARAPGWESRQPTVSAHGHTADIFVNGVVASAIETPNLTEWPEDAVLVKDSYRDDSLVLIAAMEKRAGGWFFAEWDDEGEVKFGGSPSVCLDCHGAARDFVFSAVLP
jgi:hypothetical protein